MIFFSSLSKIRCIKMSYYQIVFIVGRHIDPEEYKFTATDEGFTIISTFKEEN